MSCAIAGSGLRCNRLGLSPRAERDCEDVSTRSAGPRSPLFLRRAVPGAGAGASCPARPTRRARRTPDAQPPPAGAETPVEVAFSADQLGLRQRGRDRHRDRRGPDDPRGQQSARRQRHLEPARRRGPRRRQRPRRQPGRRRRLCRQRRARRTRCRTAWSRTCCSCSPTAAGSPPTRRSARDGVHHPLPRRLHALRGDHARRLPEGPDLADQRGPRRPRSGPPPHPLPGRDAQPVRRADPRPARPLAPRRQRRAAAAACSCPRSATAGATGSSSARLIISGSRPTATRRSRRTSTPTCCRCSRPNIAQLTSLGAFQVARLSSPTARGCRSTAPPGTPRRTRASAPISKATAASSSSPTWSVTALGPLRHRPHLPAPLRHLARRPAALVRRRRADRPPTAISRSPAGRSRACGSPTSTACSRSPCRRSTRAGGSPIRCSAAGSSCRRTASPSSAPRARTRQRAFASARWDRRSITRLGQELVLTAYARGDVYHASDTLLTQTVIYRGEEGWSGRFIGARRRRPALAVRRRRSWAAPSAHAAPPVRRLAADRESRHPQRGCALGRPRGFEPVRAQPLPRLRPLGGRRPRHLRRRLGARPARHRRSAPRSARATGSTDQPTHPAAGHRPFRPLLRHRRPHQRPSSAACVSLTHRFRIDKDSLALRRNEIDAAIGGRQTYATIGYLRLDRDIDPAIEDLRDREEIRLGGRVSFARYWSIFGSTVIDLTEPQRGSALARRRLRADPPPARHPLRRRLHRAWPDLAARL